MEKRKIGSLEVTVVGIGCDNFGGRIDEARTDEVCTPPSTRHQLLRHRG